MSGLAGRKRTRAVALADAATPALPSPPADAPPTLAAIQQSVQQIVQQSAQQMATSLAAMQQAMAASLAALHQQVAAREAAAAAHRAALERTVSELRCNVRSLMPFTSEA